MYRFFHSTAARAISTIPVRRQTLALLEHAGFGRIVIDSPAGLLANMDVAAEAARRTSSLGLVLTHWAGVIVPVIAARQLAELDRLSEGRLSLRMLAGFDGAADDEPGSSKDHLGLCSKWTSI